MIDRQKVQASFHRGAHRYDSSVQVQKRVMERFCDLLHSRRLAPGRILDIGAGTGLLALRLRELYPEASIVCLDLAPGMLEAARQNLCQAGKVDFINGDAESLPFPAGSFDLVLSTSTYQWLAGLSAAFAEAYRVLVPGGAFCLSLFGEKTLHELRASYRSALESAGCTEDRTHRFFSWDDVERALLGAGFQGANVFSEMEKEFHDDPFALLHALKRIGAGSAASAPQGLGGRRVMLAMADIYRRRFGQGGKITASYEVIYACGEK